MAKGRRLKPAREDGLLQYHGQVPSPVPVCVYPTSFGWGGVWICVPLIWLGESHIWGAKRRHVRSHVNSIALVDSSDSFQSQPKGQSRFASLHLSPASVGPKNRAEDCRGVLEWATECPELRNKQNGIRWVKRGLPSRSDVHLEALNGAGGAPSPHLPMYSKLQVYESRRMSVLVPVVAFPSEQLPHSAPGTPFAL